MTPSLCKTYSGLVYGHYSKYEALITATTINVYVMIHFVHK
ncbi:hypothetical protein UUU_36870 (plasmid) [Klebsiella pneumoniae subsp. pneumoniae DSM 30104 = JCM 1662 = NBRC 14940]|nr:hypothetical protein UUU_36870 [Klebsiella pneumoniae subsp. pneumoniae DSM 30104 = JCM 1662 = NBRC 14940]